ncbi:PITH domain-containing protein [Papiliotrema laurentii]|uniref:PITH domain-containing protein n=1 Tax=Papiliotrema laurentii TaxID=5418 RepID=A0AAD9CXG0_PAPLA|nr:PITH domain-containing protein [Papiliotrema laurentii]
MSCHDEHDHGHGSGGHGHSHDVPLTSGPADSLYGQVDLVHVSALNAQGGGEAGQNVIKAWDDRDDETKWCESDADDSLIIHIPFISSVSLRSITLKAGPSGKTPSALHLFKDGQGMDFSDAEARTPTQVLDVVEGRDGAEYQVKAAKFAGMTSLTVYIPGNNSDGDEDTTRVFYIGLRGKWTPLPNELGQIVYESAARPTDHKMEHVTEGQSWGPGY